MSLLPAPAPGRQFLPAVPLPESFRVGQPYTLYLQPDPAQPVAQAQATLSGKMRTADRLFLAFFVNRSSDTATVPVENTLRFSFNPDQYDSQNFRVLPAAQEETSRPF